MSSDDDDFFLASVVLINVVNTVKVAKRRVSAIITSRVRTLKSLAFILPILSSP
jgi:hypothetical protein